MKRTLHPDDGVILRRAQVLAPAMDALKILDWVNHHPHLYFGTIDAAVLAACDAINGQPANGEYVAVDLDANNAHMHDESTDFGWGVCRHGHGLQAFGDGWMPEHVARARADALNAGQPAYEVLNR